MGCIELCVGFNTAQRQTSTQIPIEFCANFRHLVSCLGLSVGVGQCERTISHLEAEALTIIFGLKERSHVTKFSPIFYFKILARFSV